MAKKSIKDALEQVELTYQELVEIANDMVNPFFDPINKLVDNTILDNICNYPDIDIEKIISGMEESQIETMAKNLSDRIYNGEKLDLNKINTISRVSGIDIMQRVNDMKSFVES